MCTGTITLGPNLHLHNVLYIPGLFCNLLSISKLTTDQRLTAIFNSTSCLFQGQTSGKVIGSAREFFGLYYFLQDFSASNNHRAAISSLSSSNYFASLLPTRSPEFLIPSSFVSLSV